MVKLKMKKKYKDWIKGEIISLDNNNAHALIDKGYAVRYTPKYQNKMMRTK